MGNKAEKKGSSFGEKAPGKKELKVPLIALGLSLSPAFLLLIAMGEWIPDALLEIALLSFLVLPIAGVFVGVMALVEYGRVRIGSAGWVIAIIAIALPVAAVVLAIALTIGGSFGLLGDM